MANCPVCNKKVTEKEIRAFKMCYDCNERATERREKADWLMEEERSGLNVEDRKKTFGSLRKGLQSIEIINMLQIWRAEDSGGIGIYLSGDVGTGKTHLAKCVINHHVYRTGKGAVFLNYPKLFFNIKRGFNIRGSNARDLVWRAHEVPLVVIDDLGVGAKKGWAEDEILPLVDDRLSSGLPTIFTSNYSLADINQDDERLSPRLLDRIRQMVGNMQFELAGTSVRGIL